MTSLSRSFMTFRLGLGLSIFHLCDSIFICNPQIMLYENHWSGLRDSELFAWLHHHLRYISLLIVHTSLCMGERYVTTRVCFLCSPISGLGLCSAHFRSVCSPFGSDDFLVSRLSDSLVRAGNPFLRDSQISLELSTNTLSVSLSSLSVSCSVPTEFRGVEGGSEDVGVCGSKGDINTASRSRYSWKTVQTKMGSFLQNK